MTTPNLPATRSGFGAHADNPSYTQVPSLFLNWRIPVFTLKREVRRAQGNTEAVRMLNHIVDAYCAELYDRDDHLVATGLDARYLEQAWWGYREDAIH